MVTAGMVIPLLHIFCLCSSRYIFTRRHRILFELFPGYVTGNYIQINNCTGGSLDPAHLPMTLDTGSISEDKYVCLPEGKGLGYLQIPAPEESAKRHTA